MSLYSAGRSSSILEMVSFLRGEKWLGVWGNISVGLNNIGLGGLVGLL